MHKQTLSGQVVELEISNDSGTLSTSYNWDTLNDVKQYSQGGDEIYIGIEGVSMSLSIDEAVLLVQTLEFMIEKFQ